MHGNYAVWLGIVCEMTESQAAILRILHDMEWVEICGVKNLEDKLDAIQHRLRQQQIPIKIESQGWGRRRRYRLSY